MKLRGYLLDKLPYFLLLMVAGVLSYVLLIGTGTSRDAALFAVLLRIRDNGLGIPAQDLPRVFEKGFTGANGRKLGKSTGMGLYIVRKLCDKMSIAVEAASMPGESTTITLCFPLGDEYNLTKM